jgi:hypothetical protein
VNLRHRDAQSLFALSTCTELTGSWVPPCISHSPQGNLHARDAHTRPAAVRARCRALLSTAAPRLLPAEPLAKQVSTHILQWHAQPVMLMQPAYTFAGTSRCRTRGPPWCRRSSTSACSRTPPSGPPPPPSASASRCVVSRCAAPLRGCTAVHVQEMHRLCAHTIPAPRAVNAPRVRVVIRCQVRASHACPWSVRIIHMDWTEPGCCKMC